MSLGLFVEGQSDKDTIPILIRKHGYASGIRTRVIPQGLMLRSDRVKPYIRALLDQDRSIDLVVICIDAEEAEPEHLLKQTRQPRKSLGRDFAVPIRYVIVDHALEGWLGCDTDAVRSVLGPRATVRIRGNPENHPRPADLLSRVFRDNGRRFVKTSHDRQIAERVTPAVIAARSPTFVAFIDALGLSPAVGRAGSR